MPRRQIHQPRPGYFVWTSPFGHHYTRTPPAGPHHTPPPMPEPTTPDEDRYHINTPHDWDRLDTCKLTPTPAETTPPKPPRQNPTPPPPAPPPQPDDDEDDEADDTIPF